MSIINILGLSGSGKTTITKSVIFNNTGCIVLRGRTEIINAYFEKALLSGFLGCNFKTKVLNSRIIRSIIIKIFLVRFSYITLILHVKYYKSWSDLTLFFRIFKEFQYAFFTEYAARKLEKSMHTENIFIIIDEPLIYKSISLLYSHNTDFDSNKIRSYLFDVRKFITDVRFFVLMQRDIDLCIAERLKNPSFRMKRKSFDFAHFYEFSNKSIYASLDYSCHDLGVCNVKIISNLTPDCILNV